MVDDPSKSDQSSQGKLDDPEVQQHIRALQAKLDKRAAELEKQNTKLQEQLKELMSIGDGRQAKTDDYQVDDDSDEDVRVKVAMRRLTQAKKRFADEEASRVREEERRQVGLYEAAKKYAEQFKDYGVHMEHLVALDTPEAMLAHCLEQGKTSIASQGSKDQGRVYDLPGQPDLRRVDSMSTLEKAGALLRQIEERTPDLRLKPK